jgi:hypothetical protein
MLLTKEDISVPSTYGYPKNLNKIGVIKKSNTSYKHLTPLEDRRSSSRDRMSESGLNYDSMGLCKSAYKFF